MRNIQNADDFKQNLKKLLCDKKSAVPDLNNQLFDCIRPEIKEEWLEHHIREFFIDHFLKILNWNSSPLSKLDNYLFNSNNITGEVRVKSVKTEKVRFLDYLGFEYKYSELISLLILEAKRPNIDLPKINMGSSSELKYAIAQFYAEKKSRNNFDNHLQVKSITKEWRVFLNTAEDYIKSVKKKTDQYPLRYVMTNGKWIIIYEKPNVIIESTDYEQIAKTISICYDEIDILNRAGEIFNLLDFYSLTSKTIHIPPNQILFYIASEQIKSVTKGLTIHYSKIPSYNNPTPCWSIKTFVLLIAENYNTIMVVSAKKDSVRIIDGLNVFDKIHEHGSNLFKEVESTLGDNSRVFSVQEYSNVEKLFRHRPWVKCLTENTINEDCEIFEIITGNTFTMVFESDCPCKYNYDHECDPPADETPLRSSSVTPRSMFGDGSEFHCAHGNIFNLKISQVLEINRNRCGPRSAKDGEAFCELYSFEQYLCCKCCVFHEVCFEAEVFQHRPCPVET